MMKKKWMLLCFVVTMTASLMMGCTMMNSMEDGYYTAEMSEYSFGWKEYVCIQVKNDVIVSAEFNAKNESGFIKAWDNAYMKNMGGVQGTYPNKYTREYARQLMEGQKDTQVDVISGATTSGDNFKKLVTAVIEQAKTGDTTVKKVD